MDLKEAIEKRRSVRSFKDAEIDESIINDILHSAAQAPETDSCRYYFGVIKDCGIKQQIAGATCYAQWVAEAPVIFICCADISMDLKEEADDSYAVCGMKMRYGEDIVDFLRSNENRKACKTLMQSTPVYIAAQHMILTAVSHGLRGCLVDFIDIEKINKILGLPQNITCQLLVPIGYPADKPHEKKQRDISEITFYDGWDS